MVTSITSTHVNITSFPTAQAITIASDTIAPTIPAGMFGSVILTGASSAADSVSTITASAGMIGKVIMFRIASATMPITFVASATIGMKADWILTATTDVLLLLCTAADTWIKWAERADNG
jgi:hypothetical protein